MEDNFDDFVRLAATRAVVIGFNSKRFDDAVLKAKGLHVVTTYDIRDEFVSARGSRQIVKGMTTLEAICAVNLGTTKRMAGDQAPKSWQKGKHGVVIDYCLDDAYKTARLVHKLPTLIDPATGQTVSLRPLPFAEQPELAVA